MFHGYRRYVSLVLSVCCTLSMLFLDTYEVKAANQAFNFSTSQIINYDRSVAYGTSGYISSVSGGGGTIRDGTGVISGNSGGNGTISSVKEVDGCINYHVKMPITLTSNFSNFGVNGDKSTYYKILFNVSSFNVSGSNNVSISNVCFYDKDGTLMYSLNNRPFWDVKIFYGGELFVPENTAVGSDFCFPFIVEYDVSATFSNSVSTVSENIVTNAQFTLGLYYASADEIEAGKLQVSDSASHAHLSEIESSSKAIEDSVTSDTGGGLLATIKSWFGSFFDNLIHVFVPEDGYFTSWFQRLNDLLSQKLGMLYAPFDLVISTLTAIMNADSSETGIPFPGIKWDDTWLVEPFTFTFSSLGDDVSNLRDTVYFATDVVLLFAFLYLLEEKIRHILED